MMTNRIMEAAVLLCVTQCTVLMQVRTDGGHDAKMAENTEFVPQAHQNGTDFSGYGVKVFGT
jgi:hypothetical protein